MVLLEYCFAGIADRCSHVRIGKDTKPMTAEIKSAILEHVKEYGTGSDTLRCLALGTIDNPPDLSDMDLSDSNKFIDYEVRLQRNITLGRCIHERKRMLHRQFSSNCFKTF